MKFTRYTSMDTFVFDTLDILLENEVQNNLPISFTKNTSVDCTKWLLASVKEETGAIVLVAACTPPFNIVLYETGNCRNDVAVKLLSDELKSMGYMLPGVLAEKSLAQRFADCYAENSGFHLHMSMNIMQLDKVNEVKKAPGALRLLREDDLYFAPYWERAFGEDCHVEVYDILTSVDRLKNRLNKGMHYIWEDGYPVSQAVHGRSTVNGAVINGVYTPPHYRNCGYASSTVSELSKILLERGNKFCCLSADAKNPISCGIYRKIGYVDLCVYDQIKFDG
ncbi:MAG TPA: GNAT family N-acetyltransferase [Clostridia bacterium]|nr:GNAT family N-acetyltransferase [Clostridia bacterium]